MASASTVLIVSSAEDATAHMVADRLYGRSARVAWIDTGDFPIDMSVTAINSVGAWRGHLRNRRSVVDIADIAAIYYRRPSRFRVPDGLSDGDAAVVVNEARMGIGGLLASLPVRWVNDPARVARAEYKPLQMSVAASCGLVVPPTLITNSHADLCSFADQVNGPLLCKPLFGVWLSEGGSIRMNYATLIDPADVDPVQLSLTAHLIQAWVPKRHDVRVVVAGGRMFAVEIHAHSPAARVDFRADYDSLGYAPTTVPEHVAEGVSRYLDQFGLLYGAFDFVVTPDLEWVMLECNPAGQWAWLEDRTGLPVADSIAECLLGGMES